MEYMSINILWWPALIISRNVPFVPISHVKSRLVDGSTRLGWYLKWPYFSIAHAILCPLAKG